MASLHELNWLNAPQASEIRSGALWVKTADRTDFWRGTFYDFWRDTGHFGYVTVTGDFSAEVTVDARYEVLYDQAGLMMRQSEAHWIKAGTEFSDGQLCMSVVVTNNYSDWSMQPLASSANALRLRLTRHGSAVRIQYLRESDKRWQLARLAYFPPTESIDVGVMCSSPERAGFEATFRDFQVGPAIDRSLHDE
ncbi:hypothetical protein BWP39_01585 [Paraburkholderia acidicola]|uniref:Regulation of enolase protein 1 n=1 Tax=Paraburkholderia acidicola TaxID=1912599 RepID=A0A2A4F8K1_9BURK|nr:DUF1349 domain-containing protein [Paraburkholderia acidicola]PCE28914.1 hypothetical protein BWP39_01585 [Paraburkholderia acidicola]